MFNGDRQPLLLTGPLSFLAERGKLLSSGSIILSQLAEYPLFVCLSLVVFHAYVFN